MLHQTTNCIATQNHMHVASIIDTRMKQWHANLYHTNTTDSDANVDERLDMDAGKDSVTAATYRYI